MTPQQPIEPLYVKFLEGSCTPDELEALYAYFHTGDEVRLKALIQHELEQAEESPATNAEEQRLIHLKSLIDQRINQAPQKTRRLWLRIAAAASVLIILSIGIYYLKTPTKPQQTASHNEQIAPAQKGVYLTLANGQKLRLDKQQQGHIKNSDGTQTDQQQDELVYKGNNESQMHTLVNNSSSKYSLVLADGSEVYLDIASTITYPAAFTAKTRQVSITGQAYFKVKHNAQQPFTVTAGEQVIEDIGTEFNINSYQQVTTTLVQGSVRVNAHQQSIELKPGEAAYYENNKLSSETTDIEMATIWLQGKIPLKHRPLGDVLGEVGRIYDVEFIWPDASLKQLKFGGAISRTQKLSNVLDFFRGTGKVDFIVNNKTVTVIKKKK